MFELQSYQKPQVPQYVTALLECKDKKVCTNLAKTMNTSHDRMYNSFIKSLPETKYLSKDLELIAQMALDVGNSYLIHDDTQLSKIYAKHIEGLDLGYDGSKHQSLVGIKMMTSLLTDTKVDIPIESMPYISKKLAQKNYKTKSSIAIEITKQVLKIFKFKRILADAHFATNEMLTFLREEKLNFLMKIPRSRVVTINGSTGQLKNILRLKRNSRARAAQGTINGIICYFYVVKIKNGSTMYLVSSDYIDTYDVVKLYSIRWKIELFHRTAKQSLGLGDCQMRSIEKQRQHVLHVMHAYAIASVKASLMNLSCIEDYINHLRNVKSHPPMHRKILVGGNFQYVS